MRARIKSGFFQCEVGTLREQANAMFAQIDTGDVVVGVVNRRGI